jgi:fucose permease
MRINDRLLTLASNVAILIGIALGIFGVVRGASLFIAARNQRKFDFYFPLLIAIALFALAIALPR